MTSDPIASKRRKGAHGRDLYQSRTQYLEQHKDLKEGPATVKEMLEFQPEVFAHMTDPALPNGEVLIILFVKLIIVFAC